MAEEAFQWTTACQQVEKMNGRINIVQGGTSAGKTFAILCRILDLTIETRGKVISVVTDTFPNLRRGAMKDWKTILARQKYAQFFTEKQTTHTFENLATGTTVEFFSVDEMGALGARRDYLFVNEANRVDYETFTQLEIRTAEQIWLDFNPVNEFWAHKELLPRRDTKFIKLNYTHNEGLPKNIVDTLEARRGDGTSNWWRVYGLGEIGSLEGNVYEGWEEMAEEEILRNGVLKRYGLDFGFSNDESALVAVYEMGGGRIGVVEKLYKRGLLGSQYGAELKRAGVDASTLIVADAARPEIIAEIRAAGFRIVGANKNAGSVMRGIDRVKQHQVLYAGDNLRREYMTYAWRKKRSGEILDEPQDGNDHLMDALRYAVDDLKKPRFDF